LNASIRMLWLTIFALSSLVLAIACGILVWAKNRDMQAAIVAGGATFAGALTLLFAAAGFLEQS
jgi:cytochrome bd-type quinol oxidase subunit 2